MNGLNGEIQLSGVVSQTVTVKTQSFCLGQKLESYILIPNKEHTKRAEFQMRIEVQHNW